MLLLPFGQGTPEALVCSAKARRRDSFAFLPCGQK